VRCIVVDDAVDIKLGRHSLINLAQEVEKFLMPVAWLATGQHRCWRRPKTEPLGVRTNSWTTWR